MLSKERAPLTVIARIGTISLVLCEGEVMKTLIRKISDRISRIKNPTLLMALMVCAPSVVLAETTYWRLSTDRMTVIANDSARRCTTLAHQFSTYERVLRELANLDEDVEFPPIAVYSLSQADARKVFWTESDRSEQQRRNMMIYSRFLPGNELDVAAIVDVGDADDQALQSILLLYGQSMLANRTFRTYPAWYQIGVANITNGLVIRKDGSVLLNRKVQFEPDVERGATKKVAYDLATMLDADGNDVMRGDIKKFSRLAREWAQFGLLTLPERRAQFHELALLMRQGAKAAEAVPDAFGVPLQELAAEFEEGKWQKQVQYKIPAPPSIETFPDPQRVEPDKAVALLKVVAERVEQQGYGGQ